MYIKYITYSFLTAIRPHVYDSWNITKQKKIEKIMQFPFIKSPLLWYGSGFSLKIRYYYACITNNYKTTHFLNGISSKNFKILNYLRFNWCISISYTIKNSLKNSIHNPNFEIYIQNFELCDGYYFVMNILHTFKFFNVC
jgi:hypothetical protein